MEISEIPNYKEWLAALEVGQDVAIEMFADGEKTKYQISNIIKIEGNLIEVRGFNKFKDGVINRFVGHLTRLCPITESMIDEVDRKSLLNKLYDLNMKRLTTEQLRKIWSIVNC